MRLTHQGCLSERPAVANHDSGAREAKVERMLSYLYSVPHRWIADSGAVWMWDKSAVPANSELVLVMKANGYAYLQCTVQYISYPWLHPENPLG